MFLEPTRSGGYTYLQLVESYRNDAGQRRQRTVVTLGRLDQIGGGVDSLLSGLLRVKGLTASAASQSQLEFDSSVSYGDVWALNQLWCELGFDALAHNRQQRHQFGFAQGQCGTVGRPALHCSRSMRRQAIARLASRMGDRNLSCAIKR
jgi:hypothetical protein